MKCHVYKGARGIYGAKYGLMKCKECNGTGKTQQTDNRTQIKVVQK